MSDKPSEGVRLRSDPRVEYAQILLHRSREADGQQVSAARWWGRLEAALEGVIDAIKEEPPF
ncbi:hypothetical protein ACFVH6_22255 [Spirillospora sp. NPDC127200]